MAHSLARQSIPIPVVWGAFRSDTYQLGKAGWQVAIEEELMRMELRMLMHHHGCGITMEGRMQDSYLWRQYQHGKQALGLHDFPPFIITRVMARETRLVCMDGPRDLSMFSLVDTTPLVTRWEGSFQDLPLFAKLFAPKQQAQELIVDPQDVQAMLDQIMKVQAPIRREIRDRDKARERMVHAEIVTLAA